LTEYLRDCAVQGKSKDFSSFSLGGVLDKFNEKKFKSDLEVSSGLLSKVHGKFLSLGQFDNSIVLRG